MSNLEGILGIALGLIGAITSVWFIWERVARRRKLSWKLAEKTVARFGEEMAAKGFSPTLIVGIGRGGAAMGALISGALGQPPRNIKEEVALDLVLLTHGSPAAVLGFERRRTVASLPGMDLGIDILNKAMLGLTVVQEAEEALPAGYDVGVLMAWRDAGTLFSQGVERIELTLNHRERPITTAFTPSGYGRIQERIKGPQTNIRTIEGRLLMADFKEHGTRCRVHPSVGEPVLCLFDGEQKDEVLEDILQFVRIIGEAKEDPITGKIASIKIHDIERLEDREDEAAELLPQGTPVSRDFWESPTLDELAHRPLVVIDRKYVWQSGRRCEDMLLRTAFPRTLLERVLLVAGEVHTGNTMRLYYEYFSSIGAGTIHRAALLVGEDSTEPVEYVGKRSHRNLRLPWMAHSAYRRDSLSEAEARALEPTYPGTDGSGGRLLATFLAEEPSPNYRDRRFDNGGITKVVIDANGNAALAFENQKDHLR